MTKHRFSISVFILIYISMIFGCSDFFQDKVAMNLTSSVQLTSLISPEAEKTMLDTPSEIFVGQNISKNEIFISWSSVEDAVSYCVEKAVVDPTNPDATIPPDDSEFEVVKRHNYGTTYTDTILQNPTYTNEAYTNSYRYYYRVSAENIRDNLESSLPTANTNYGTLFKPVTNVNADMGKSNEAINISWDKVTGAQTYEIYKRTSDDTVSSLVDTVYSNSQSYKYSVSTSEQGVEFYFTVIAKNSSGNESATSPEALGYALKQGAPQAPKSVTLSDARPATENKITVNWSAAGGFIESNSADGKIHYTVYRSSSVDSSKTVVASDIPLENGTAGSYEDTKQLKQNVYYYYYVKPWYTDITDSTVIVNGAMSDAEEAPEGFLLSCPTSISAIKQATGTLQIKFLPAIGSETEQENYRYVIYSCDSQNGSYCAIPTQTEIEGATNSDGYIEVTLQSSETTNPFYKIGTYLQGNEYTSAVFSSAVSPAPYAATDLSATRAQNIGESYTANASGVYPVKLTWNKPSNDEPAGYYVYRSTKADSGYKKITDEVVTDTSYVDENASSKSLTVYYYKVLAVNSLNQGANYSNAQYGYGALSAEQYLTEYVNTIKRSQAKLTYMHKSSDTDKLNTETISGDLTGTLYYSGAMQGLSGAYFTMTYTNYSDYYISFVDPETNNTVQLKTFFINGNADSSTNLSGNGNMKGTVTATDCMYPGTVLYDTVELTGGKIKGGTYGVTPSGFSKTSVSYLLGTW